MRRSSGILLHISSLPSEYGIGTLGRAAYAFADFLAASGQKYWQTLPLGPTGYGDSPYQCFSSFAGNPYFIDLDILIEQGLLTKEEAEGTDWGDEERFADYGKLYRGRFPLLKKAYARFHGQSELEAFAARNEWLSGYALFMALKDHFGGAPWTEWPDDIQKREPNGLLKYTQMLRRDIGFYSFLQYEFDSQWEALRKRIKNLGLGIIGDLPIYVPLDSADVWANPEVFCLDCGLAPTCVAGVPPDYFCTDGQLWGNPVYDWEYLKKTGYAWWLKRAAAAAERFDVIRLDHFRGFCDYWTVPFGEKTAKEGEWKNGPGEAFIDALKAALPNVSFIAEDLGFLNTNVRELLAHSGFPGMKVLQFAFDSKEPSDYLPHNYERNCACYTGTHDNATARAWFEACSNEDRAYAARYLGLSKEEGYNWGLIRGGMVSVADLFVAQMQDYLDLGEAARMNRPGEGCGNWRFRLKEGECTPALAAKIAAMTRLFGR